MSWPCSGEELRSRAGSAIGALAVLASLGGWLACSSSVTPLAVTSLRDEEQFEVIATADDSPEGGIVVHQFLYGENPGCTGANLAAAAPCARQPFLRVPEGGRARFVHEQCPPPDEDCQPFFRDAGSGGSDDDAQDGLEHGHLVFYSGHGKPRQWNVRVAQEINLDEISLGDQLTRYLWLLSCQVMAHGPLRRIPSPYPASTATDFLAPQEFDPQDSGQPNVFQDFATNHGTAAAPRIPLNAGLRIACGGSTRIGGGGSHFPMAPTWHYKLLAGLPVADSFILGLANGYRVPLCLARGGAGPEQSPLYDAEFVTSRNAAPPSSRLYLQYPVHLVELPLQMQQALDSLALPTPLVAAFDDGVEANPRPVLELDATPPPRPPLGDLDWDSLPRLPFGFRGTSAAELQAAAGPGSPSLLQEYAGTAVDAHDLCVKRQQGSGAFIVSWRPRGGTGVMPPGGALSSGEALNKLFEAFGLSREQWTAGAAAVPDVRAVQPLVKALTMRIDGVSESEAVAGGLEIGEIDRHDKCFYLALEGNVEVRGLRYPVLGQGAEWLFAHCPRGATPSTEAADPGVCERPVPPVLTAVWVGRRVVASSPEATIGLEAARIRAREELGKREPVEAYDEQSHRFGYKAAPVHCSQRFMYLVYEFDFVPKPDDRFSDFPEITIEVPAHRMNGRRIEDTWQCSPETGDSG